MNQNHEALLALTRNGIGHFVSPLPEQIDWEIVQELANAQGLSAVVLDGVEKLPDNKRPPKDLLLQWIGNTLQSYEYRYELYCRTIAEIAAWYNSHGFKMMILKGYACSLNWPKPEHRPCGDIDIWLFGKQKEADMSIQKDKGIIIDNSEHHHSVYYSRGIKIENHYDFLNVYQHKSSAEIEILLKHFGEDDSYYTELYCEKVYLPSPNLHALLLLRHSTGHFAAEGITLRHILDWGFFVKKHSREVDWGLLMKVIDKYGMKDFFCILNAICVDDFGFDPSIFPMVQFNPSLKDKVLQDILYPKYSIELPKGFIFRIIYKIRRWQGNAWKQRLCYNESRWSMFWTGIWAKVIKPASI